MFERGAENAATVPEYSNSIPLQSGAEATRLPRCEVGSSAIEGAPQSIAPDRATPKSLALPKRIPSAEYWSATTVPGARSWNEIVVVGLVAWHDDTESTGRSAPPASW